MHITRLNIERVRNLKAVALQELQPFNVFYGQNGSGKTSVLEAIHLLATVVFLQADLELQHYHHSLL